MTIVPRLPTAQHLHSRCSVVPLSGQLVFSDHVSYNLSPLVVEGAYPQVVVRGLLTIVQIHQHNIGMPQQIRNLINLLIEHELPETWIQVKWNNSELNVGWNNMKNQDNLQKHEMPLSDGINVLSDPNLVAAEHEKFNKYIGRNNNDILVVAAEWLNDTGEDPEDPEFTEEIPSVRLISVRHAEPPERQAYNSQNPVSEQLDERRNDPPIDPDNPPITDFSNFVHGPTFIKQKIAEFEARKRLKKI